MLPALWGPLRPSRAGFAGEQLTVFLGGIYKLPSVGGSGAGGSKTMYPVE